MPPRSLQSQGRTRAALVVGLSGVLAGVLLFAAVVWLIGSDRTSEVRLGDDVFEAGDAERLARSIDEDGPLLFSDVAGGDRDVYLQHLGSGPRRGWLAFDARPPGTARDCFLRWRPARRSFVDCRGRRWPADGGSLAHYWVTVDADGELLVDLRRSVSPPAG